MTVSALRRHVMRRSRQSKPVPYAGNELRGYGNLVLIKHADGRISAYAHCDELLVKKGASAIAAR
jgi:septal ring factor EnvC (AmiA/AmiB activator)